MPQIPPGPLLIPSGPTPCMDLPGCILGRTAGAWLPIVFREVIAHFPVLQSLELRPDSSHFLVGGYSRKRVGSAVRPARPLRLVSQNPRLPRNSYPVEPE